MISDRANKLHFSSIVVDAHCDSITRTMDHQEDLSNETFNGHLDLPRMKMGNVSCQFFSCLVHPKYINEHRVIRRTLGMIDAVKALCLRNPETISLALSASHVREVREATECRGVCTVCVKPSNRGKRSKRVQRRV